MSREACLVCRRPQQLCVCRHLAGGPFVENRTEVVILQHRRERLHPFGTVRIARLGLANVRVEVAGTGESLERPLTLPPGTGLLYPCREARPLDELAASERPSALLVLDGTWQHAKRLYRANEAWLGGLPHYSLRPTRPSNYRIRAEPDAQSVSTIEAIVEALRLLEPETAGGDRLLGAFNAMIDEQLAERASRASRARRRTREKPSRSLARRLVEHFERLVVVYAESARDDAEHRRLVRWSAARPRDGVALDRLLRWPAGCSPDPAHLAHMDLTPADLDARGGTAAELLADWQAFAGPSPLVVAWSRSPLDLEGSPTRGGSSLQLKAAYCNQRGGRCGSLEEVVDNEGLRPSAAPLPGRAGVRLSQCLAVVALLRQELGGAEQGGR